MKSVEFDRKTYYVREDEFIPYVHPVYNNLKLFPELTDIERTLELLKDLQRTFFPNLCCFDLSESTRTNWGGYLAENLIPFHQSQSPNRIYCALDNTPPSSEEKYDFVLTTNAQSSPYIPFSWKLSQRTLVLNVHSVQIQSFMQLYRWYIPRLNVLEFDNLIHLVMIVKNAGDTFKEVLEKNIPHIDRWTILDTGSTDNTVQVIQQTLGPKVRGELYQEPFVDFGTSRNRVLELAGQVCKFTLMLDDTYYIEGDLRGFLNEVRSDQFSDSFSLYITSDDVQYVSNRLLKTYRQLKYWYKIHEVIQETDNKNVIVPIERARIHDKQSDYMQNRTISRKTLDLQLLQDSIKEDPDVPRHYYYMAQTYVGMENWEMAYKFFLHRVYHHNEGFLQEKIDACFEAARTAQFRLNRPWEEVKPLYEKAYAMDPSRPDSVYFLGIKEYLDNNHKEAYELFKKAYHIGYPIHAQYSLKPTLSFHYNPKFLVNNLCWTFRDYDLGEKAAKLYIENNPSDPVIESWYSIYRQLNQLPKLSDQPIRPSKPYFCFLADGNWNKWTGRDLHEKGLGGSETYIVEMAKWIQASGTFNVIVFCRCSSEEVYEGVQYLDISKYYEFIANHVVHSCMVSRFSEYLPLTYRSHVQNVFLVVHDLTPTGVVLIRNPKLKAIFTLTEWHKEFLDEQFPTFNDLTTPLHYGIHSDFLQTLPYNPVAPLKRRFIYSSFPNRGLLPLLEMWPSILYMIPDATLDIYSNLKHPWCLQNFPEQMAQLEKLVQQPGVHVHGWVNKKQLAQAWKDADIWFYPCIFKETFCLTALEAAASKTLAITTDLAALQNTVGNRGFMLMGDPLTTRWKSQALNLLQYLLKHPERIQESVEQNYQWALEHSWKNQSQELLKHVLPHRLEYRNVQDWTLDVSSRVVFKKVLDRVFEHIICPTFLEIGSQSGTSLVHLLEEFPDASGTIVDSFSPSIQASLLHNLEPFKERITIYKNAPQIQLLQLIADQQFYHLIHIQDVEDIQSDKLPKGQNEVETERISVLYTYLLSAWKLLLQGGVLIYNSTQRKPIHQFTLEFRSEVKILYRDTRIFLQKTRL